MLPPLLAHLNIGQPVLVGHSDGGTIALTAQSDRLTTAKWDDWFTGTRDLEDLAVADFEVVEAGERIAWTGDCVRE